MPAHRRQCRRGHPPTILARKPPAHLAQQPHQPSPVLCCRCGLQSLYSGSQQGSPVQPWQEDAKASVLTPAQQLPGCHLLRALPVSSAVCPTSSCEEDTFGLAFCFLMETTRPAFTLSHGFAKEITFLELSPQFN